MNISPAARVVYGKNPLAEVVCQIRFQRLQLPATTLETLQHALESHGYSQLHEESSFSVLVESGPERNSIAPQFVQGDTIRHFSRPDGSSKISLSSEFIAFTSNNYSSWDGYLPGLLQSVAELINRVGTLAITRIGLRYRDVIERSVLGLEGIPWYELINPFLLGPLANNALCEEGQLDEKAFESQISQCLMRLDECSLLLQTSLLTSVADASKAFLIDADFFHEIDGNKEFGNATTSVNELVALLETLHSNAGALFRRAITEKLHDALCPQ